MESLGWYQAFVKSSPIGFLFLGLLGAVVAAAVIYRWDISENRGWHFGYYGEFNRVQSALAGLPGLSITDRSYHGDVGLEEFSFEVATKSGRTGRIDFSEVDPVRKLSGDALKQGLLAKLEKQNPALVGK